MRTRVVPANELTSKTLRAQDYIKPESEVVVMDSVPGRPAVRKIEPVNSDSIRDVVQAIQELVVDETLRVQTRKFTHRPLDRVTLIALRNTARQAILEVLGSDCDAHVRLGVFPSDVDPRVVRVLVDRNLSRYPLTAEEFRQRTGRDPKDDDLARVNCDQGGKIGHLMCGWCLRHASPRYECGCPLDELA